MEIIDGKTVYNSLKTTTPCSVTDPEELVRSILTSLVTVMEGK